MLLEWIPPPRIIWQDERGTKRDTGGALYFFLTPLTFTFTFIFFDQREINEVRSIEAYTLEYNVRETNLNTAVSS